MNQNINFAARYLASPARERELMLARWQITHLRGLVEGLREACDQLSRKVHQVEGQNFLLGARYELEKEARNIVERENNVLKDKMDVGYCGVCSERDQDRSDSEDELDAKVQELGKKVVKLEGIKEKLEDTNKRLKDTNKKLEDTNKKIKETNEKLEAELAIQRGYRGRDEAVADIEEADTNKETSSDEGADPANQDGSLPKHGSASERVDAGMADWEEDHEAGSDWDLFEGEL